MPYFNTVHTNQPLTNLSQRYNWAEGIAEQVFPVLPVAKETDLYYVYSQEGLRMDETLRANRAESNVVGQDYSSSTYTLQEHALKELISDRDRLNMDLPLNLDADATLHLTEKILIRREVEVARLAFTTTNWGQNATIASGSAWDTQTSTPISDVLTATTNIMRTGAIRANRGVMGVQVFNRLKVHSTTIDRIRYTQLGLVTEDLLGPLFDLDKVLVGKSVRNTNAEGVAASNSFIWGSDMLVYNYAERPSLRSASAGYILQIGTSFRVKKWREEKLGGDFVEVSTMFLPRAVATSAAYLIKQAIT